MQLTKPQLVTLKNDINAQTDPTFVAYRNAGNFNGMSDWYNVNSTFVAWKTSVTIEETGAAFNGAEWASKTSGDIARLTSIATYLSSYSAADEDIRTMFNDIWSASGGAITRANLLALWKRLALRGEKVYCTGTGTDATPGLFGPQGSMTPQNISDALGA